jgi:hypothetical protein
VALPVWLIARGFISLSNKQYASINAWLEKQVQQRGRRLWKEDSLYHGPNKLVFPYHTHEISVFYTGPKNRATNTHLSCSLSLQCDIDISVSHFVRVDTFAGKILTFDLLRLFGIPPQPEFSTGDAEFDKVFRITGAHQRFVAAFFSSEIRRKLLGFCVDSRRCSLRITKNGLMLSIAHRLKTDSGLDGFLDVALACIDQWEKCVKEPFLMRLLEG